MTQEIETLEACPDCDGAGGHGDKGVCNTCEGAGSVAPDVAAAYWEMITAQRDSDFAACPILRSYVAALLEDLQASESDDSCTEERDARDSGTIYTLPRSEYEKCKASCLRFMAENAADLEAAGELEPGEPGLQYSRGRYWDSDQCGYMFYMERVGHGVSFTDDGDAPCLQRLRDAANNFGYMEGAYFGDDGRVYLCGGDA